MIRLLTGKRLLRFLGFGLLLFSVGTPSLAAMQKKDKKAKAVEPSASTFHVHVNLVSVNVNVTDMHGLPVSDLKEKDFRVLDNGAPEKISVFRMETIPGSEAEAPAQGLPAPTPPPSATTSRKVILFVDDYSTDFSSMVYVKKAGEQFIRTGLGPNDLVALVTASGKHSTEFTMDREFVIANLRQVLPYFHGAGERETCPPIDEYQALLIDHDQSSIVKEMSQEEWGAIARETRSECCPQCDPEMVKSLIEAGATQLAARSKDSTRRVLSSLQSLTRRLNAIEGPKELLFLSPGFFVRLPIAGEFEYDMNRVIDSAIRANTVIDSVNATGLAPDIDASSRMQGTDFKEVRFAREDSLYTLANETGGKLYHNSNDLFGLMKTAIQRSSVNYILGFYPTDERRHGEFHKLVVKVDRPGVSITARKGYFAPKGEESFETISRETIRAAMESAQELKDIPVALSFNITHTDTPESLVEVRTRIDVKNIQFRKKENRNQDIFSVVTIVYDNNNQFVDGREARLEFNLTDPHYQEIMKAGLVWAARFKLPADQYTIKTTVQEAGEGKLGSAFKTLDVLE